MEKAISHSNDAINEGEEDEEGRDVKSEDTEIHMQSYPSNRHRKKVKVKAWCSQCFQFFANGPFSKACQAHYERKCNVVSCQKALNSNDCVRMFSNVNSENRHTHCLKRSEVQSWNKDCELRNCLGLKRENDCKMEEAIQKEKEMDSHNCITTHNMGGLIAQIGHLNFNEEDPEFNNFFNLSMNINEEDKDKDKDKDSYDLIDKPVNVKEGEEEVKGNRTEVKDTELIEEFFNRIQEETAITTSVKKKLIKAFRSKGILNVKTLKLFLNKNTDSNNVLIEKFKSVTSQIEGVALCIEYLLQGVDKKLPSYFS